MGILLTFLNQDMKIILYTILALLLVFRASAQSPNTYKISGMVVDSLSQKPLDKVTLSLSGNNTAAKNTTTKPDGKFELAGLQKASYILHVHNVGFKPVELASSLKAI
jgi:hypothetical protein